MPNIATLNTVFTATVDKFESGVHKAHQALEKFHAAIFSIEGALAVFGIGLGIHEAVHELESAMKSIDEVGKASDRLGVTTESLLAMRFAAKEAHVESEALDTGLNKMAKNLEGAAAGGAQQTKIFDDLHVSVRELTHLPLDKAFGKMADAINALPTPMARTAAAMNVFGKAGAGLLPLLSKGSAGIGQSVEEFNKLGASFSRIDAAQVEAANRAIERMEIVISAVWTQLAIQLSPLIEAAASAFTDWATTGTTATDIVTNGIEGVVTAAVFLADKVQTVKIGFDVLRIGALEALAAVQDALDITSGQAAEKQRQFESYEKLRNAAYARVEKIKADTSLSPEQKKVAITKEYADLHRNNMPNDFRLAGAAAHDQARSLADDVYKQMNSGSITERVAGFFKSIREKAHAAAADVAKDAGKAAQIRPDFGKVLDFFGTLKTIGVNAISHISDEMNKLAVKVKEDNLTPLKKYEETLAKLQAMQLTGKITPDEFVNAKITALKELGNAITPDPNRRASLQEFGTQAAFTSQLGGDPKRTEKEILASAKRQEELQKKAIAAFKERGEVVFNVP